MNEAEPISLSTPAVGIEEESAVDLDGKYLSFWIDRQMCGVPIVEVMQIVGVQEITELPQAPSYVAGLINLRGSIIPIVDVRLRLGKSPAAYDERTCIIVSNINGALVGFLVDAVDEVTAIDLSQISQPPQIGTDESSAYLIGVATQGTRIILLISTTKLLGEHDLRALSQSIEEVSQ